MACSKVMLHGLQADVGKGRINGKFILVLKNNMYNESL
jgi:hypothetical protein